MQQTGSYKWLSYKQKATHWTLELRLLESCHQVLRPPAPLLPNMHWLWLAFSRWCDSEPPQALWHSACDRQLSQVSEEIWKTEEWETPKQDKKASKLKCKHFNELVLKHSRSSSFMVESTFLQNCVAFGNNYASSYIKDPCVCIRIAKQA